MDIIHLLPDSVANQIAAGEVIQRPSSCLKELVENSLDAGATKIQIIVQDAGRTLLQVIDNGKGMSETDARMAFERHATSKISKADDLFSLHTMGFRGEALASIAAVAQLEMTTKRAEDEIGTLIEISGSQVVRQEPDSCQNGTNMKIKNLFFNVPARRRFLKTNSTELRNIISEYYRIALVYPQVQFTLVSDDEILSDLPASNIKQRIENIFGRQLKKGFSQHLVEIEANTSIVNIYGFVGNTEGTAKQAQQYFFVNGRFMKHPYFHKAVMTAYQGMLMPDQNPHYFIYFDIAPDAIDINIHPTKTEIKFADEQPIWQILQAAVREALGKFNVAPSIDFNREGEIEIPQLNYNTNIQQPSFKTNTNYNPFEQHKKNPPKDWQQLYTPTANLTQENNEDTIPLFENNLTDKKPYQYANKYIILPCSTGLMIINQHRAHAAVLYDRFLALNEQKQGTKQQVLFPEIIDLDISQAQLLTDLTAELQIVGFEIAQIGKQSFSVDAVPAELGNENPTRALMNILHEVEQTGKSAHSAWHKSIAIALANTAAISSGKSLTEEEMKDLTDKLFARSEYIFTPDGKRIITIIDNKEIDNKFA